MIVITVAAAEEGWRLSAPGEMERSFATGAQAERAAKEHGRNVALSGRDARIEILLRSGRHGGSFLIPAGAPESSWAA